MNESPFNVQIIRSLSKFLAQAEPFLLKAEAENNLILGITGNLVRRSPHAADVTNQERLTNPPFFFHATHPDGVVGAALLRSSPLPLGRIVLTSMPEPATRDLAKLLVEHHLTPSGAVGPVKSVLSFSAALAGLTGKPLCERHRQEVYELTKSIPPRHPAPGLLRPAQITELALIQAWGEQFIRETGIDSTDMKSLALGLIQNGQLFVWEEQGIPRTMAAWSSPTLHGVRINLVYTPPEERKNGWASSAVAGLGQRLLSQGRRSCYLFPDLANPASNRLYQAIGYQAVCEFRVMDFQK